LTAIVSGEIVSLTWLAIFSIARPPVPVPTRLATGAKIIGNNHCSVNQFDGSSARAGDRRIIARATKDEIAVTLPLQGLTG
jgi:hypothetical protein